MADYTVKDFSPAAWLLLPAAMVSGAIAGVALGGGWVWLGIAELPLLALVDTALGPDHRPRAPLAGWFADLLLVLQLPLVAALWCVFAWRVGPAAAGLQSADWVGLVLSTAFVTAYGALPASHELGHRDDVFRRKVGNLLDTFLLAPYGVLSHNHVHHLALDTLVDAETARRGQSVYSFMIYMGWNRHLESWRVEAARLRRMGYSPWSWRSAVWRGFAQYALVLMAVAAIAGGRGVGLAVLVSVLALLMLTALSYSQHYGLTRLPESTVHMHHAWNHLYPLTRGGMFEITTHSQHHMDIDVRYWNLTPLPDAPQMPSAWLCLLMALLPPLWLRVMRPRLADWDQQHAVGAEQSLARQANAAAGWSQPVAETT
ncbi:MAG: fatty acid desaturase [Immundisolibacter sp.]|uniref:fatty acid desaturase n=1 Tax=Immundisolibacter sp. TaxID=1934948 RepID=UPI003EDF7082